MNAIRCCLILIILMSSSFAFAGKSLFCANKFSHGDSDILADAGFFFDEAWLNCKDIKGNDFTLVLGGGGLTFRAVSSLTILSCPFLPKKRVKELVATGLRLEAIPLLGARAGVYVDKSFGPCGLIGLEAGFGAGIVMDSVEIRHGKVCDAGNCPSCCH
jgi:hypothetical protein